MVIELPFLNIVILFKLGLYTNYLCKPGWLVVGWYTVSVRLFGEWFVDTQPPYAWLASGGLYTNSVKLS